MIDNLSLESIVNQININQILKSKIKRILITGISGFIGNYLLAALMSVRSKKFEIYGIDRVKPDLNFENKNNHLLKFYQKDLSIIRKINLPNKLDLIIHLAGIPSPTYYKKYPLKTFYLNSDLTKILLERSKIDNSKMIYFSSSEIYGDPEKKFVPTKESYNGNASSIGERSCYDESKRSGETYSYIYKKYYNVDCKIIRPFNFYGNGMKQNDKRIIPQFFSNAINNKDLVVFNKGTQTRSYCNIIDAVPILLSVIFCGSSFVYNVGNNSEEISALNLGKKIRSIFNKRPNIKKRPYPKSYPSDEPKRRCPNLEKLKKEFKYKPKVSLDFGLRLFKDYALDHFKK